MDREAWWATVHGVPRVGHGLVTKPPLEGSKGFLGDTSDKESACQCRRCKRFGFDSWVGKIPWTEEPGGLQSMGSQELDATENTHTLQLYYLCTQLCFLTLHRAFCVLYAPQKISNIFDSFILSYPDYDPQLSASL